MKESVVIWSALAPWLLLVWCFQRLPGLRGLLGLFIAAVLGTAVVFFPWFGHPVFYWAAALSAGFSVIMAFLLVVGIAARGSGREVFTAREWDTAWIFGAVASLALYPSAFGPGPRNFDAYALGWPWLFWGWSGALFGAVTACTAVLLWRGNRFGYALLLALTAYACDLQESRNLWDYLLDPVYGAVSLVGVIRILWRRLLRR